jgi:hypothetical protein
MKRFTFFALALFTIISGCRKIEVDGVDNTGGTGGGGNENLVLSGKINTDRTLKAGNTYRLRGIVYVVEGAKLTIEPGVIIQGEKSSRGTLVITRGTQILANGAVDKPIVFTTDAATPASGDWGGIVILGRARVNSSYNGVAGLGEIEGGINNAEGFGLYGGADDNDNSGILKYVRIEYAGYAYLPDKELNGLTMGGVGKGTIIDYIQISNAADDSFEWFGGSVDCKHLIAYKGLDDDWDIDNGFSGRIQFGISMRDSMVADISQSNGFEIDNDAGGSNLLPQTSAVFSNMTVIGPRATLTNIGNSLFRRGIHTRRNSAVSIFNSIIMGWPVGWNLDGGLGTPADLNYSGATPKAFVSNTILAGNNTQFTYTASASAPTGWSTTDLQNYFNRAGGGNSTLANSSDVMLGAAINQSGSPDWNPTAGSPALTGADFSNSKVSTNFFNTVAYRGACGPGDTWWKGWTKF